jgi:hypothetical protein
MEIMDMLDKITPIYEMYWIYKHHMNGVDIGSHGS